MKLTGIVTPDILNKFRDFIIGTNTELTIFQKEKLSIIFEHFNKMPPDTLHPFQYGMAYDDELLLYKSTNDYLLNIIINPEESVVFSYIPRSSEDGNRILYFSENDEDIAEIANRFFEYKL